MFRSYSCINKNAEYDVIARGIDVLREKKATVVTKDAEQEMLRKRINNPNKSNSEFDQYFKFEEIEDGVETQVSAEQTREINEIMSKINIHKIVN